MFVEKKLKVEFKIVKKGQILSIKRANGSTIYTQQIKNTGNYSSVFDLSQLPEGKYTTELEKDFEIIIKSFSVVSGKVSFESEKKIFKPVIRIENNLVLIAHINFEKTPININLYYNNELILSEEAINTEAILKRVYRLSNEEKGNYSIIVHSGDRHYTKKFTI
jgi:hypothetical protein